MGLLSRLLGRQNDSGDVGLDDDARLSRDREVQQLRLELTETQCALSRLQGETAALKGGESKQATAVVAAEREALFSDLAGPLAQLSTQAALADAGAELKAHDVLAVVSRLTRTLEDHGVALSGDLGAFEPFDPDRHAPLTSAVSPKRGQPARVRVLGVTYSGKMLRKIGVDLEPGTD